MIDALETAIAMLGEAASLTGAELELVRLSAIRVARVDLARARGVAPSTVKKQVQQLLRKTRRRSLEELAADVLLVALSVSRRR